MRRHMVGPPRDGLRLESTAWRASAVPARRRAASVARLISATWHRTLWVAPLRAGGRESWSHGGHAHRDLARSPTAPQSHLAPRRRRRRRGTCGAPPPHRKVSLRPAAVARPFRVGFRAGTRLASVSRMTPGSIQSSAWTSAPRRSRPGWSARTARAGDHPGARRGGGEVVATITMLIDRDPRSGRPAGLRVAGIGVGLPGLVDVEKGCGRATVRPGSPSSATCRCGASSRSGPGTGLRGQRRERPGARGVDVRAGRGRLLPGHGGDRDRDRRGPDPGRPAGPRSLEGGGRDRSSRGEPHRAALRLRRRRLPGDLRGGRIPARSGSASVSPTIPDSAVLARAGGDPQRISAEHVFERRPAAILSRARSWTRPARRSRSASAPS